MKKPTQKALLAAVKANPDLLPRLLMVAEQMEDYSSIIDTPERAYRVLAPMLEGHTVEHLAIFGLNRKRRLVASEILTRGNSAFTIVCPRQILKWCLLNDATAFVLGHNHPSGDPEPSDQDREVTERVGRAARTLGIPLLDHLTIGGGRFVSMANRGWIPPQAGRAAVWTA